MKRLMKIMVAAVTSVCLLAMNLPITALDVRADGDSYVFENYEDEMGGQSGRFLKNNTPLSVDDLRRDEIVLDKGNVITITLNDDDGDEGTPCNRSLEIWIQDAEQPAITQAQIGSSNYELPINARIYDIRTDGDVMRMYIAPMYKVTWQRIDIARNITFSTGIGDITLGRTDDVPNGFYHATLPPREDQGATEGVIYLDQRPTQIVIDNPGGMAVTKLSRLQINDTVYEEGQIQNHFDRCVYDITFDANDQASIILTGDPNATAVNFSWINHDCDFNLVPEDRRDLQNEMLTGASLSVFKVYEPDGVTEAAGYDYSYTGYVSHGYGDFVIEEGHWIEFVLTPVYGSQIERLSATGRDLQVLNEPNHYIVQAGDNNVHITPAYAEGVHDEVRNAADAITGGEIHLTSGAIPGGSGALKVEDNALTAQEISSIESSWNGAGDLTVQDSLSIDFDNVYMKPNTNGQEEWAIGMDEFDNNGSADITLRMDHVLTDVDFNSIVIVHEHTDANGIVTTSVIEDVVYNTDTNTITFNTNGFSDFTIATVYDPSQPAIEVNPNPSDPYDQPQHGPEEQGEGESERPHYSLDTTPNGFALIGFGYDEETDTGFDFECEPGFTLENDAVIDIGNGIPEDMDIKVNIDGEIQDYYPEFCAEHWVLFDSVTVNGNTVTINLHICWIVRADIFADVEITVNGDNGELLPIGESDPSFYPLEINVDEEDDDPHEWVDLVFDREPVEVIVRGNDYLIMEIFEVDEDDLSPIGDNTLPYPDNGGCMWFYVSGIPRDGEDSFIIDTPTLSGASFTINGTASGDHVIVIQGFESSDIPEEISNTIDTYISSSNYDNAVYLYGFEIYLLDETGIVTEPGHSVTITLQFAEALDLADGTSVFFVHMHQNGSTAAYEIIEGTYNATNRTVTFTASSFSPFIMYKGTRIRQTTTTDTTTPAQTDRTTPAATATTEAAAETQAVTPVAETVAAATPATTTEAQITRTGEKDHCYSAIGTILILSAAAVALYDRKRESTVSE